MSRVLVENYEGKETCALCQEVSADFEVVRSETFDRTTDFGDRIMGEQFDDHAKVCFVCLPDYIGGKNP